MNQPATTTPVVNANNFELNKGDDFIIALDISGSMQASDCPGGLSRLKYSLEQFRTFVGEAAKYDTDGVSLYAFGIDVHQFSDVSPEKLEETVNKLASMRLESGTMTDKVILAAYEEHVARKNEQTVLMVFTDGEPNDQDAVFKVIADITNKVKDEREFNISFLTVGNRSASLEAFLAKLDDALPGAKYDIVDVKRVEDVNFYQAFDGALND